MVHLSTGGQTLISGETVRVTPGGRVVRFKTERALRRFLGSQERIAGSRIAQTPFTLGRGIPGQVFKAGAFFRNIALGSFATSAFLEFAAFKRGRGATLAQSLNPFSLAGLRQAEELGEISLEQQRRGIPGVTFTPAPPDVLFPPSAPSGAIEEPATLGLFTTREGRAELVSPFLTTRIPIEGGFEPSQQPMPDDQPPFTRDTSLPGFPGGGVIPGAGAGSGLLGLLLLLAAVGGVGFFAGKILKKKKKKKKVKKKKKR